MSALASWDAPELPDPSDPSIVQGEAFSCLGLICPSSAAAAFLVVTPLHLELAALALLTTDHSLLAALHSPQPYEALCSASEALQASCAGHLKARPHDLTDDWPLVIDSAPF